MSTPEKPRPCGKCGTRPATGHGRVLCDGCAELLAVNMRDYWTSGAGARLFGGPAGSIGNVERDDGPGLPDTGKFAG